ncbi:MAG: hypothetical protein CBC71_06130 [Rhodobacteraceae bacterium TMED111]|nr:hypothetical protein [Marinovum sp.]OUV41077.1 MAG: hypothetical protein CBC71_06130 [Rhodobacteraceae bacterium TMED111]|tara:strand:+ start:2022 stop:2507 length:486 start_codon:yes stop_codon:yes gene_type:complete
MAGNWTIEEKKEIVKAFTVLATIQKSYGNIIEIKPTLRAWEVILYDCPAMAVVNAMHVWSRKESSMPTPSDILKIIKPEKPEITRAEFLHAKEQHALEGFPICGYYGKIIQDYEAQEGIKRELPTYYEVIESRASEPMPVDLKARLGDEIKKIENENKSVD